MKTLSPNSAILEKTRELCSLILNSSEYKDNTVKVEAFFANEGAQKAYRDFARLGEDLHQKQHAGDLTDEDIELYEQQLEQLKANPVAADFLEAEENINAIAKQISKHISATLELGRLPEPEDLESGGCCGGGCGCH